jgi:hypothetical protein
VLGLRVLVGARDDCSSRVKSRFLEAFEGCVECLVLQLLFEAVAGLEIIRAGM